MQAHEGPDFYQIESLLTAEEKDIRDRVRRFVDDSCMPIIAEHFDKATFPLDLIPQMVEMELFGVHVEGYGCRTQNETIYGLICQELSRCDSGLRAMFSVQNSLVMYPIFTYGSQEQRQKWLPRMATGEVIGCFGLSEPESGSDPGGMKTMAEPKGNGYLLNGTKMWITNGTIAKVAVVWAKLDDEVRGFLVESGTPGFKASPIKGKFSYRTSPTALLVFRDCEIPEQNILPKAIGLKSAFQCLNLARYGVACGAVGSAMACYQAARSFAMSRQVFKKPIASYQLVQDRLVTMLIEITKAQLLNYHLGRMLDEKKAAHTQISLAKMNNVRQAMNIARMARDILGARGILSEHQVIRHLCDLEAQSTLEGTENIHTLILGQEVTGIPAFY
jgi:glutaryl-CoA dehydrogenase